MIKTDADYIKNRLENGAHGSGINADWLVVENKTHIRAENSFHCMTDSGMYDAWADFWIEFPLTENKEADIENFKLHFSGPLAQRLNRKYALREYLDDTIYCALKN